MFKRSLSGLLLAAVAVLAGACSAPAATQPSTDAATAVVTATSTPEPTSQVTATPAAEGGDPMDYAAFVSAIKADGWPVEETGATSGSIFSGNGHIIKINGVEVQVFEYADTAALDQQAANISPDGSKITGTRGEAIVDWVDMPHFFKKGRILVVYVGRADGTLSALNAVLGNQFAGGTIEQWGPGSETPIPPGDSNGLPPTPTP